MVKLVGDFRKMVEEAKSLKEKQISDYVNSFPSLKSFCVTTNINGELKITQKGVEKYQPLIEDFKARKELSSGNVLQSDTSKTFNEFTQGGNGSRNQ